MQRRPSYAKNPCRKRNEIVQLVDATADRYQTRLRDILGGLMQAKPVARIQIEASLPQIHQRFERFQFALLAAYYQPLTVAEMFQLFHFMFLYPRSSAIGFWFSQCRIWQNRKQADFSGSLLQTVTFEHALCGIVTGKLWVARRYSQTPAQYPVRVEE